MFHCKTFKTILNILDSWGKALIKRVGMISTPLCWKIFVIWYRKYIHTCWECSSRLRTCFIHSSVFLCLCWLLKWALTPIILSFTLLKFLWQGLHNLDLSLCSLTFLTIHWYFSQLKKKLSWFSFFLFSSRIAMNWFNRSTSGRAWKMAIF